MSKKIENMERERMNMEKELIEGVYLTRHGKIKVVEKSKDPRWKWEIDSGATVSHPFLRVKQRVTKTSTGNWFANKEIKNCEYLGSL